MQCTTIIPYSSVQYYTITDFCRSEYYTINYSLRSQYQDMRTPRYDCKRFDAQRNILFRSVLAANVHIDLTHCCFEAKFMI
jgi:transposase-like protein